MAGLNWKQQVFAVFLYVYLVAQVAVSLFHLPSRVMLHIKCWESSRTVEVDNGLALLRGMIQSDTWAVNRAIGLLHDGLAVIVLVTCEVYLQLSSVESSVDPLYPVVVSICATTLLSFVLRVVLATLFSLSCHDPQVLSEARRRGLSAIDIDILPTFVFTSLEEVNNSDCSICLCNFELGEMLISLPCDKKHAFHSHCIRQWLQRQNSCPLCQKLV